jgi:hypothetical protein
MLGRDAASALPELRQIAADRLTPSGVERMDRWRMTLIKLGAQPSAFKKPSNVSGSQSRYETGLGKDAQQRSCTSF